MNYNHSFHAGNIADIFKHSIYLDCIISLQEKFPKIEIYDLHAGSGIYNLFSPNSLRTGEFLKGAYKLYENINATENYILQNLYNQIQKYNYDRKLIKYPGSPLIAIQNLRKQDKLYLIEKNPKIYLELIENIKINIAENIIVKQSDIWIDYKRILNDIVPKILLIDSPFEEKNEINNIEKIIKYFEKSENISLLIWYPVKMGFNHEKFLFSKYTLYKHKHIYEIKSKNLSNNLSGSGIILLSNILHKNYEDFLNEFNYFFDLNKDITHLYYPKNL